MPYSSGTFSFTSNSFAPSPVTGTTISSTAAAATWSELATALSTCVLKDGTQTLTANIPMASFKLTGLAAGSTNGDSVRWQQSPEGLLSAKGGLISASAANTPSVLAVGADGKFLGAASGQTTGLQWQSINDLSAETTLDQSNDALMIYDATDSTNNKMTPAKFVEGMAATQAEIETGTSTGTLVVPGRQQFHNSAAKCWVLAGTGGTALASYNITSVTDTGTGTLGITIANDFNTDLWVAVGGLYDTNDRAFQFIAQTTGTVTMRCAAGVADPSSGYFFAGFGDQP